MPGPSHPRREAAAYRGTKPTNLKLGYRKSKEPEITQWEEPYERLKLNILKGRYGDLKESDFYSISYDQQLELVNDVKQNKKEMKPGGKIPHWLADSEIMHTQFGGTKADFYTLSYDKQSGRPEYSPGYDDIEVSYERKKRIKHSDDALFSAIKKRTIKEQQEDKARRSREWDKEMSERKEVRATLLELLKGGTSPESAAGIASIKHNRKVTKVVAENVNREEGERTGERPYPIYTTKEYGFNEANRLREEQKLKDMFSGFNRVAK